MRSAEQLRAEVRRLHGTISTTLDPAQRRDIAQRAFELAQQAELIASLPDDVEGLWRSKRITTTCSRQPRISASNGFWRNCCKTPKTNSSKSLTQTV